MQANRQLKSPKPEPFTTGPGKICQALAIDRTLNNWDVTLGQMLWIEKDDFVADDLIVTSPRIGIDYVQPQDRDASWRFWIEGNGFVSK